MRRELPKKADLNFADLKKIECYNRRIIPRLAADELGITERQLNDDIKRIFNLLREQGAGTEVPNSRQQRAFCARCLEPLRTTNGNILGLCERCDPPHTGCSNSSPLGTSGIDDDYDAFKPNWKE